MVVGRRAAHCGERRRRGFVVDLQHTRGYEFMLAVALYLTCRGLPQRRRHASRVELVAAEASSKLAVA